MITVEDVFTFDELELLDQLDAVNEAIEKLQTLKVDPYEKHDDFDEYVGRRLKQLKSVRKDVQGQLVDIMRAEQA